MSRAAGGRPEHGIRLPAEPGGSADEPAGYRAPPGRPDPATPDGHPARSAPEGTGPVVSPARGIPRTLAEIADRIALRELVDTYAHAVDHRLPDLFSTLFHPGGRLIVPHPAGGSRPPIVLEGHHGWEHAFAAVAPFAVTSHFVGNHLVRLEGDSATARTSCLVHEIYRPATGAARMQLRLISYADTCVRHEGRWLFRTRALHVDWHDDRALGAPRNPFRETGTGVRSGKERQR
ncbi:nuclear transport factor 2 family protein [Streptomyces sp. NBC_01485]|uniref:nuclear transport factor 2 family protein n=1 Tax=Streptomyces sp. NBC_01485 TaxID=2903884 RepID=UPI002E2EF272|nr:nuclear transport factor 2 family protein [Streptomyces sp. NBC_01485]